MVADYEILSFARGFDVESFRLFARGNTTSPLPQLPHDVMELIAKKMKSSMYKSENDEPVLDHGNYKGRIYKAITEGPEGVCYKDNPICVGCAEVKTDWCFGFEQFIVKGGYDKCRFCSSHAAGWTPKENAEYDQFTDGYSFNIGAETIGPNAGCMTHSFMDYIFMRKYVKDNFLEVNEDDDHTTLEDEDLMEQEDYDNMEIGIPAKRLLERRIETNKAKRRCIRRD
jgi:hypothetical protein